MDNRDENAEVTYFRLAR